MAITYYDDAIIAKIKRWIPEESTLRVLKPDETKRLIELTANDKNDAPITLPLVALSRDTNVELLSTIKQNRSFDGLHLDFKTSGGSVDSTLQFNIIPIKVEYQLDIYTKTYEEGDEYLRTFLFKLINNPKLIIDIPYNDTEMRHTANIRVLSTIADTSDISERIFSGQFTRWTVQFELQDAFLFNIPYRKNWKFICDECDLDGMLVDEKNNIL